MDKSKKHNVNERSHSLKNIYKNPHKVQKRALLIYSMRIQTDFSMENYKVVIGKRQASNVLENSFPDLVDRDPGEITQYYIIKS